MVFAMFLLTAAASWAPMRWSNADSASLGIFKDTPVNCLLLEKSAINAAVASKAAQAGIQTLVLIEAGGSVEDVQKAAQLKANGVVFEGKFEDRTLTALHEAAAKLQLTAIDMLPRVQMKIDDSQPVVGTYQGVWPGIQVEEGGTAKAAPSGAPWINTNSGFLRFMRSATKAPLWIGVRPPVARIS